MRHLELSGLAENTLVVIYSDHGMEFFEHNTWGQGNSVISDVSTRIPLLIYGPGVTRTGVVRDPVRSIDVMPTLEDLCGINRERGTDGVSLMPYLKDAVTHLELDAFSETGIRLTDLPETPPGHLRYPNLLDLLTVRNKATGTLSLKPETNIRSTPCQRPDDPQGALEVGLPAAGVRQPAKVVRRGGGPRVPPGSECGTSGGGGGVAGRPTGLAMRLIP